MRKRNLHRQLPAKPRPLPSFPLPPSATTTPVAWPRRNRTIPTPSREYRAAIKEYPDYLDALSHLSNLQMNGGDYTGAIANLRQVVMLKPNDANARNDLGYALKKSGDSKAAAAEYLQAIRLNPKLAIAHNNLANLLYANKLYPQAIEHYRIAVELQPNNADAHMNLATALDVTGKTSDAILEYKEAVRLRPNDAKIRLQPRHRAAEQPGNRFGRERIGVGHPACARLDRASPHAVQAAERLRPQDRAR